MATSKTGASGKLLSISGKVNVINKVDGISNVCCTKIAEELDISMRKGTVRILGQSGRGENV
jgi:hypothetical protein